MTKEELVILTNIIGAVESGGQVYGNRRYDAYAAPYTNSNVEHTITLGWAQNYGDEARKLILMILDKMGESEFRKIDTDGSIYNRRFHDWVKEKWNPTAAQKKVLIKLIDSKAGHECQDELFERLMETFVAECEKLYTSDTPAVMMYCEIRHLGGAGPVKRIFNRAAKPYTPETIYASLLLDQKDTSSSNQVGDKKFQSRHQCCVKWINQYVVNAGKTEKKEEDKTVAVHYISNSGGDENGGIHGGTAGDQTGREWQLRSWYNRPWSCVLRHPNEKVREKIADLATKAAKNDKIGYDQYQRDTYWQQLQKVGYDPSKITTACEADCSAGVIANTRAVGYLLGIDKLKNVNASYTGNMRAGFKAAGFEVLTASKYLTSPDYLLPGDILLNDSHHTATNITKGSKADGGSGQEPAVNPICGTCTVTLNQFLVGAQHNQVKAIQRILNALGYKGKNGKALDIDGELGENTSYAIAAFQKAKGLDASNPGTVAAKTWNLLLNA